MMVIPSENIPDKNVVVSRTGEREVLNIKSIRIEILEDGSNTQQRFAAMNIFVPAHTPGPPQHWHQMNDETFLVVSGEVTFISRKETVLLKAGDYIVVPPMAPHTFANNGNKEAVMFATCSPGFFMQYFRDVDKLDTKLNDEGEEWTPEIGKSIMLHYGTFSTKASGYGW